MSDDPVCTTSAVTMVTFYCGNIGDIGVFWAGAADAEGFGFNHHCQSGCQNVCRGLDMPLTSSKDVNKGRCQIFAKVHKRGMTKTKTACSSPIQLIMIPSYLFPPWPCPFPAVTPGKYFFPWLLTSKYIPPHYILLFLVFFTISPAFNQYFPLTSFHLALLVATS